MGNINFGEMLGAISLKWWIVAYIVASATYIHYRGRIRHTLKRQAFDHSTIMAPYNVLVYARSAVANKPMLDRKDFPELDLLRDNWEVIRDEAKALFETGQIRFIDNSQDIAFNTFKRTGWTRFYLKWYRDFLPSAQGTCPKTVELLKKTPSVKAAMFTVLAPGSRLGEHRDPFAGSVRYHLGLVTPNSEECCIWVDGNRHVWHDGEDVLFDETFIHSAQNNTQMSRIILFADVERPLKDPISRFINHWFGYITVAGAASRNVPDEKLGLLNHAFTYIYKIRVFGMWLKEKNRKLYYVAKWVLFGSLLYWILI